MPWRKRYWQGKETSQWKRKRLSPGWDCGDQCHPTSSWEPPANDTMPDWEQPERSLSKSHKRKLDWENLHKSFQSETYSTTSPVAKKPRSERNLSPGWDHGDQCPSTPLWKPPANYATPNQEQPERSLSKSLKRKLDWEKPHKSFQSECYSTTSPVAKKPRSERDHQHGDYCRPRSRSESSHQNAEDSQTTKDDEEGHMVCRIGYRILDRYEIVRILGQGTFGRVVECLDHHRGGTKVAVKIIRNTGLFRETAQLEINVLKKIQEQDREHKSRCVMMWDSFEYHGHACIVFELLGKSTYDFLKENNHLPYPLQQIRHMAFQLFHGIKFLHDNKLTHTDLKPENILFVNSDFDISYSEEEKCEVKRVKNPIICVADFGNATFDHQFHCTIVATRYYRPPEVILELGWAQPCDVWSLGCILFEYYTGYVLFQANNNREHLVMMEKVLGQIPHCMVYKTKKEKYFRNGSLIWDETTEDGQYIKNYCHPLGTYKKEDSSEHAEFFDLLQRMLEYSPALRITMDEALRHPFFSRLTPEERKLGGSTSSP
ncbi:dual specificity protein kinase CLK3-like [Hyla sarda]|uniref:dual specificity protein kinase CLK3-like n=1 Tax=Hyla sarda TaxID=327740 RepID=UPI0024C2A6AA|nr:dual specificity protein kinase CLK3-like [Hyla sarda]